MASDKIPPNDSPEPTEFEPVNPFDPAGLRLSQDYAHSVGVKKVLATVPVRKPTRQEFVRVHPNEDYRLETAVIELKEEREVYLVERELWSEMPAELVPKLLSLTINRQNILTLWPVRLPAEDGRHDTWNASALEAAAMAQQQWIRVAANLSLGAYDIYQATGDLPEPQWPDLPFADILKIAFKDRFITTLDHPVIRRLWGEL